MENDRLGPGTTLAKHRPLDRIHRDRLPEQRHRRHAPLGASRGSIEPGTPGTRLRSVLPECLAATVVCRRVHLEVGVTSEPRHGRRWRFPDREQTGPVSRASILPPRSRSSVDNSGVRLAGPKASESAESLFTRRGGRTARLESCLFLAYASDTSDSRFYVTIGKTFRFFAAIRSCT